MLEKLKEKYKKIRWTRTLCRRTGLTLAALLIFFLALTTHPVEKTASADNSSSSSESGTSSAAEKKSYETKYEKFENDKVNNTGFLVLDNKVHSYTANAQDLVPIYSYLFNAKGEQVMTTSSMNVSGNKDMFAHLNSMISDFAAATSLRTIMVTNSSYLLDGKVYKTQYDIPAQQTQDDKAKEEPKEAQEKTESGNTPSSAGCFEHLTGLAVDLQLYEMDKGTYPEFTGEGKYAWINENCWKYGFVLRYPAEKLSVTGVEGKKNHYRYVGQAYAKVMHDNDLVLEELYDFLSKYTYEQPLVITTSDGKQRMIYSAELDKENSTTTIPTPETSKSDMGYEITGNGGGRVFICADIGVSVTPPDEESSKSETQSEKTE
ncbi:D-alanyl-D-alanine carboxypeptidase family protein [Ruminococcus sp. FC2018]|uniref:D-alanyl-D-alanine carboxypeptidase family protein n=1 Tax=Ruminococcus sp. FC2018 TaxID=1410617 RepID=UPI00048AF65D|nr:D-alanyl-D-alanine carboxypeptidase family protein [Ruminococcus sp. FC2018]